MSHREVVPLFLAMLAVLAQVAVVATVVVAVVARRALRSVRTALAGTGPWFALLVATIATSGSLYFSEILHFVPCTLCWWQRGFMYPLVPLLVVGLAVRPAMRFVRPLALAMAVVGGVIAAYHNVIERWPQMEVTSCSATGLCRVRWVEELGYVTIPVMSLSAFLLIVTLLVLDPRRPS